MSKIREAALRQDLSSTLWRVGVTQDNSQLFDLLPEQLRMLLAKYPADCQQHEILSKILHEKESAA